MISCVSYETTDLIVFNILFHVTIVKKIKYVSIDFVKFRNILNVISDYLFQFGRYLLSRRVMDLLQSCKWDSRSKKYQSHFLPYWIRTSFVRTSNELCSASFFLKKKSWLSIRAVLRSISYVTKRRYWILEYFCHSRLSSPYLSWRFRFTVLST